MPFPWGRTRSFVPRSGRRRPSGCALRGLGSIVPVPLEDSNDQAGRISAASARASSSGSGDRLRRLDVRRALFRESALLFAPTDASADLVGRGDLLVVPGLVSLGRAVALRLPRVAALPAGSRRADPERLRAPPAERDLHGSALHDLRHDRVERALGPRARRHAEWSRAGTLLREVPSRRRDVLGTRRAPPHVRLLHALSRRGVARFAHGSAARAGAAPGAAHAAAPALPLQHVERDLRAHAQGRGRRRADARATLGFPGLTLEPAARTVSLRQERVPTHLEIERSRLRIGASWSPEVDPSP